MANDGALTVAVAGGSLEVAWVQLVPAELASLALDVARGEKPEMHALAAFYLLLAGDAVAARPRLAQAGAAAVEVEATFGIASGG